MTAPFVNWARNVRSQPTRWERPASVDEVVAIVRAIRARGGRLRVCGTRHSWSAIAASEDVQMELSGLADVVSVDATGLCITVQGGCTLRTVNRTLAAHGLALPILGSIDAQTVSGAVATGTHGSSLRHQNLAGLVEHVRLVDGTGEIQEIGVDDPRMDAVRVHLGALGVITEVTLRVEPAFGLIETRARLPIEQAAAQLATLAATHEYIKLWWLPPCADVMITTYARTDAPVARGKLEAAWERTANATLFPLLLGAGRLCPDLIPSVNRLVDTVHFVPGTRSGASHELLTLTMPPRHHETELAFGAEHAADALLAWRDWVLTHRARLDFLTELRFVQGDQAWMSPAFGRDTCQLGVYATHSPDIPAAFAAFRALGERWGARPHWGKQMVTSPALVAERFPRAEVFRELAGALDPDGVFRSAFLDSVLGGVSALGADRQV